ncbi:MAG: helix-turn-helix domain-containing protein [Verrucomicrobia bacterium]|nr:helix-turn-helix domain-containing protein [Verrucomicrobiota bacterium]MCH8528726.1 helix-turn-helix domain-containing protein [Kiritimatiellia bacterium]
MKYQDQEFSSPALAQGIEALNTLNALGPMSLEALSQQVGGSKSSLWRHLRTLAQLGLVEQRSRSEWAALRMLVANVGLEGAKDAFRKGLMDAVAAATGLTVEWYRGMAEGMALRDQRLAETEVRVVARPGFLRSWGEEVDAVARLGYAFDPEAPVPEGDFWRYSRNGHRRGIQAATVVRAVRMASRERVSADRAFNSNLVRRSAIAVFYQGAYLGVLAVAEPYSFQSAREPHDIIHLLKTEVNHADSVS